MDDLFAAITAFLREHNSRVPVDRAPIERVWTGALRRYGGLPVYCRYCGRPILGGDGLFELEELREDRACAEHHVPFSLFGEQSFRAA